MSRITRTVFYRELWSGLFSPARYIAFASFFTMSAAMLTAALQIGEGKFWTLTALWTVSVAIPMPLLVSLITMPLFAGERAAGTYEQLAMLPVPMRKFVIGKFSASFISACIGLAGTLVPWLLLRHFLGNRATADVSLAAPLTILVLHAFSWTALGTLSSAFARKPWIAAVGTFLIAAALIFIWAAIARFFPALVRNASSFPIWNELLDASAGRIALHTFAFHISFAIGCLYTSTFWLEARR